LAAASRGAATPVAATATRASQRQARLRLPDVRGKSLPRPFSIWQSGRQAQAFDGRASPHPAAADVFHGLRAIGGCRVIGIGRYIAAGGRSAKKHRPAAPAAAIQAAQIAC
jgi:hypothetical protein